MGLFGFGVFLCVGSRDAAEGGKRRGDNAARPVVLTGVEALYDGCRINEVPAAEHAHEMGV